MEIFDEQEFAPLIGIADQLCTVGFGNFAKGEVGCFSNYAPEFQELYHKNNWVRLDPVVQQCGPKAIVFDWGEHADTKNKVMEAAREFGMRQGVSLSSQIAGSGLIVSYSGANAMSETAREEAARLLHKTHMEKLVQNTGRLNKDQCELVSLFAHGMRAGRVAEYFEVSEDAIKLRKRRIETLMGVNNFLAVVHICAVAGVTVAL